LILAVVTKELQVWQMLSYEFLLFFVNESAVHFAIYVNIFVYIFF